MKTVHFGCAILATIIAILGMFIRPFNYHLDLPRSSQTTQAFWTWEANPTPENEAIMRERISADVAYNQRHEDTIYIRIGLLIIAAIWLLSWLAAKRSPRPPISN